MSFLKKKKTEIPEKDLDKIREIRERMHPGDTKIDEEIVNKKDKRVEYKPLNDIFRKLKNKS